MDTITQDNASLKEIAKDQFGMSLDIDKIIADSLPVSPTARATVFLTKKKQLMVYIDARSSTLLSDIKKMISRMGMRTELFMPPKGQPQYFDDIGVEKFKAVFPGRHYVSGMDIQFYRTLAPYNPALALISEVKDGHIYQFDSDAKDEWRVATQFAYRRIRTS